MQNGALVSICRGYKIRRAGNWRARRSGAKSRRRWLVWGSDVLVKSALFKYFPHLNGCRGARPWRGSGTRWPSRGWLCAVFRAPPQVWLLAPMTCHGSYCMCRDSTNCFNWRCEKAEEAAVLRKMMISGPSRQAQP